MKKLNESRLKIGDIILTTTNHKISKSIRTATKSDISHAMIYAQSHSVIDATLDGVHARNTQRLDFEDNCSIHVLRLKKTLSQDKIQQVIDYARNYVGTEYSKKEAIKTALGGRNSWTKKQFCSRLVAQSYAQVDVLLVENVNYCSPQDIKDSPLLISVDESVRDTSDDEIAAIDSISNTGQSMIDATNKLLSGARKICSDIQTFDDFDKYLFAHPKYDMQFAELYEISGYLDIWKLEKEKNSWQYDIELMTSFELPDALKTEYCEDLLKERNEGISRFQTNLAGYTAYAEQYKLKTFQLLQELYENLVSISLKRVRVAEQWLINNSSVIPVWTDASDADLP